MDTDHNKGISSIRYNHLNLPVKITFTAGNYILYTYDAAGVKLRKEVHDVVKDEIDVTDYIGGFIYQEHERLESSSIPQKGDIYLLIRKTQAMNTTSKIIWVIFEDVFPGSRK